MAMAGIGDVVEAHTAGFELEDVKFSFTRDIRVSVAGTEIDARDGEVMNLPRYVASVLEGGGHGRIEETDMVVELKQAVAKENMIGEFELATLEDRFYIRLRAYAVKLPEADRDRVESMLNKLVRKRQGKIVSLADSSKLTAELASKMTVEEKHFYNGLHEVSEEFVNSIMWGKGK